MLNRFAVLRVADVYVEVERKRVKLRKAVTTHPRPGWSLDTLNADVTGMVVT